MQTYLAVSNDGTPIFPRRLYSAEDVRIDGVEQSTLTHIRAGLEGDGAVICRRKVEDSTYHDEFCGPPDEDEDDIRVDFGPYYPRGRPQISQPFVPQDDGTVLIVSTGHDPICRTQCRMALTSYGWPVKYFKDLIELVGSIEGAVQGASI